MKPVILQLLASFVLYAAAHDYLELNKDNFESTIGNRDLVLVKFYAEWCGHCKRMAPEFAAAATELLQHDPPVTLVKVNCPENEELCKKHGVSGYPTIKVFRRGEVSEDFQGARTKQGIVDFMSARAGPASAELKSEEELEKLRSGPKTVFLALFKTDDSAMKEAFEKIATRHLSDFKFCHTSSEKLVKKYGGKNAVVRLLPKHLVCKLEEPFHVYTGSLTDESKIVNWLLNNWSGVLAHRTQDNLKHFSNIDLCTIYFNVDYDRDLKGTNYYRNRIVKAVKDMDTKFRFAMSNAKDFENELEDYGLDFKKEPLVAIVDKRGKKFVMREKFDYDQLKKFVKEVEAGKVEAYLKSEEIPTSDDGPVKKVVAKNFDSIVNDKSKDVLIEFYAPWCGHCKKLKPIYEDLAKKLADHPNVVIAAMDATANDVPANFNVRGFPTIYFAPKGDKENPKQYEGGRTLEDFVKYLKNHSSEDLSGVKDEL